MTRKPDNQISPWIIIYALFLIMQLTLPSCLGPKTGCTFKATRCAKNVVKICDDTGRWIDLMDCDTFTGELQCQDSPDGAGCGE